MKKFIKLITAIIIFVVTLHIEAKLPEKEGIFEFNGNKAYLYLPNNFQKGGNYKFILFFHGAGYSNGQPGNVGHVGFTKFRQMAAEKGYIIAVPSYGTTWYNRKAENITINDLVNKIKDIVGSSSKVLHLEERPGDVKHSMAAIDKLKATGFKHKYSFDEGLATTIEYFKSIAK